MAHPGGERLVAAHVLGDCPVGSAIVVVGCNSPHRREAIGCTEYLIDELSHGPDMEEGGVRGGREERVEGEVEWREGRTQRVMVKVVGEKDDDRHTITVTMHLYSR